MELLTQMLEVLARPTFLPDLWRHVELSVVGVIVGVAIAIPVAVLVNRSPLGSLVAINVGNIGRAVPSLAILALALPIFGFGYTPSIIALIAMAIPPVLINTITGLREVSPQVVDAARGMGLSGAQIMRGIQLPIAAPVIFAGIRTSAVQVVASATLATFIGGGGLGNLIVEGVQRGDPAIQLVGALSVAALAIITEFLFGGLERRFTPKGLKIAAQRSKK